MDACPNLVGLSAPDDAYHREKVRPASKLFNRVEMLADRAGQIGATSGASPQTAAASIEQTALPPPAAQAPRRPGASNLPKTSAPGSNHKVRLWDLAGNGDGRCHGPENGRTGGSARVVQIGRAHV